MTSSTVEVENRAGVRTVYLVRPVGEFVEVSRMSVVSKHRMILLGFADEEGRAEALKDMHWRVCGRELGCEDASGGNCSLEAYP